MAEFELPHVKRLRSLADQALEWLAVNPNTPPDERDAARRSLAADVWLPHYVLPQPATGAELVAAEMMTVAHLKAAEFGLSLGEHLTAILYWAREPEARAMRIADAGDRVAKIAEAMVQAGRAEAQRLGGAIVDELFNVHAAIGKLESMLCPCCGRAFGSQAFS